MWMDPSSEYVDLAAELLGLLSDPTRIRIVLALRRADADELSVTALAEVTGKKPSGVSQHLARLRMARMVTTRQEGTSVLYRLADEHALKLVGEAVRQAEHAVAGGHLLMGTSTSRPLSVKHANVAECTAGSRAQHMNSRRRERESVHALPERKN